jgi:hypothetical protein
MGAPDVVPVVKAAPPKSVPRKTAATKPAK